MFFFLFCGVWNTGGNLESVRRLHEERYRHGRDEKHQTGAQKSRRAHVHPARRGHGSAVRQQTLPGVIPVSHQKLRATKRRTDL